MHLAGLELTSISLAGSGEQIKFSQQSLKMLKMASESFNQTLVLYLGFFLNDSRRVPLETNVSTLNLNNNSFLGTLFIGTFEFAPQIFCNSLQTASSTYIKDHLNYNSELDFFFIFQLQRIKNVEKVSQNNFQHASLGLKAV